MLLLDHSAPTPEENLALDEALLDEAEQAGEPRETLRLWESSTPAVIVGRSSHVAVEVNLPACRAAGVNVLRRTSGGAAVVIGPGCLMYAVVLSYARRPELRALDACHRFVMGRLVEALGSVVPGVSFQGTCDLTLAGRKCSGNSLRCRREHLLYHGTLLYNFPLERIEQWLNMPPRVPEYRQGRPHRAFVANVPTNAASLRSALRAAWSATEPHPGVDPRLVVDCVREKYANPAWNERW